MMQRFAFSTHACPEWNLYQIASNARLFGFAGVELRTHSDNHHFSPHASPGEAALIGRVFRRTGVSIYSIAPAFRIAPDECVSERLQHLVNLAHHMGAGFLRIRLPRPGLCEANHALAELAPVLRESARYAAAHNVTLALETSGGWAREKRVVQLAHHLSSMDGAKILLNLRAVCLRNPRTWKRVVRGLLPRTAYIRVADGYRSDAHSTPFAPIGCGEVPVKSAVQFIKRQGFGGFINFEWDRVAHPALEKPEVALPRFMHVIRRYWRAQKRHSILV